MKLKRLVSNKPTQGLFLMPPQCVLALCDLICLMGICISCYLSFLVQHGLLSDHIIPLERNRFSKVMDIKSIN